MDSPSSTRSSPSKALNPLSPERMNQQALPNSPSSVSDILRLQRKGNRGISDVQAKVAYLNNLSRGGSPGAAGGQTSTGGAAALQRAILGREEAESALARVSSQLSEAQSRERRISERLEALLEEFQVTKERQAHERLIFEKEIRKARKEAFRASSTLVKVQEDLKQARSESKALKDEVQCERDAKGKAKQEAFERAYAIAGLTEELEELKGQLRTAEANNHANSLQARAQEINRRNVGRMSLAEGDLALITSPNPRGSKRLADDSVITPAPGTDPSPDQETPSKRVRLSDIMPREELENYRGPPPLTIQEYIEDLKEDLEMEKRRRLDAEDLVEYMKVECMFKLCTCRIIEKRENEARAKKQAKAAQEQEAQAQEKTEDDEHENCELACSEDHALEQEDEELSDADAQEEEIGEPLITFSPVTGTFHTIPSPSRLSPQKKPGEPVSHDAQALSIISMSEIETEPAVDSPVPKYESHLHAMSSESIAQSEAYSRDLTPGAHYPPMTIEPPWQIEYADIDGVENANDIPNVKRVPLRTDDQTSNRLTTVLGTPISREQALAQIRARRGRTTAMKRSVSANDAALRAGALSVTPVRVARRIPGVQHSDPRGDGTLKTRRDLTAPMRMFHQ